jgi:hypothetical protein
MQDAQSQESEVQTLLNSFVGTSTTTIFIMTCMVGYPTVHVHQLWCLVITYTIRDGSKLDA